jgi:hypothetical protein
MKLESLSEHLNGLNPAAWNQLYELVQSIYVDNEFGKIIETEKKPGAYLEFPHWTYTSKINEFHRKVYDMDIVVGYDWLEWKDGQAMLKDQDQDYTELDGVTLCKLITMIVRAERFYEGFMNNCFTNGSVLKIVTRLNQLYGS